MGGVASAVSDVVGGAVEAVGDAVEDVGQAVIDNVVEPVASAVENTVQSIADDPIGSMAKIAAVATGQFELLPLISAADTLAHGGSLEQAALNAGISAVGAEVGGDFADYTDSGLAGGMAAGATGAAIRGGDITQGALSGGINYGINSGINEGFNGGCGSQDCGSQDCTQDNNTDTSNLIASSGGNDQCAQGCASTQDLGGLPTVVNQPDVVSGQSDTCASDNCMGEITVTAQRPDCVCADFSGQCQNENVNITGGNQDQCGSCADTCTTDQCASECCSDCCSECCCDSECGSNFKSPFKVKIKGAKGRKTKTPKTKPVRIGAGKNTCTASIVGGLGSLGGSCAMDGCGITPWLDSKANMLQSHLKVDEKGNLITEKSNKDKANEIYGRMDQCLAQEFQDRFGGVPQVDITAGGGLGGNFARASGYAGGGCVNSCYCMNQNPKYFPRFLADGPDMLTTSPSAKRQQVTPKQLHQLAQQISSHGNMGNLAKGGLPQKYQEAAPKGHNPEFVTGLTGYYACGGGTGQSDDIKAMLHDGDYVMDADVVAALGDGSSKAGKDVLEGFLKQVPHRDSAGGKPVPANIADGEYVFPAGFVTALGGGDNKAGAKILDGLREKLRAHKRSAPTSKIPPKAKSPLDYIKQTKG
jgi:hypothetical protein